MEDVGDSDVESARDDIGEQWRIDDLARMSGITVDTIRFYQREGLLPAAQRHGRSVVYGPEHLERLEVIRDLQAKHFSLKAIRALAGEGRLQLLQGLFLDEERTYTREELVAASGLPDVFVHALEQIGVLAEPWHHGGLAYDGEDLGMLTSLASSLERGMPEAVCLEIVRLYHLLTKQLMDQLYAVFAVRGGIGLGPEVTDAELDAFRTLAANDIDAFVADAWTMLHYMHRRSIQRMVAEAMGRVGAGEEPAT
ncbi:MAG: MerR family transcriptional regulator [Acidimicrobiales bacterium]